ncbi:MAG: ABC transporter permease [Candidatus Hydrogenedentes bacterium]|nr:ABC transporter permease [Candidatus Hydrogenedentota bacterium]
MIRFFRALFGEYRTIFSDSGVFLILLAGLMIYTMVYPLPYSTEVMKEVPVIGVDQDHTALSRKLMRWADATEEVRIVKSTGDLAEAQQFVLMGEACGVFAIPEGFERDILRGEQAVVSSYAETTSFLTYRQVATGLYKATATLSAGVEVRRMTAAGFGEEHAKTARDPLPLVTRPLFNPAGGYGTYAVPGVLILIMQQTLLIAIGMLGGTRNEAYRTAGRIRAVGFYDVLARGVAFASIYYLYPLFYMTVVFRIFDLPNAGNVGEIMLFMLPFVLAVSFLGLTLSALFGYREVSIPALIFSSLPAVFLTGIVWPVEAIPTWLRHASFLLPSTMGCPGFVRLNQMGAGFREVQNEWTTLWLLAGLYVVLAWLTMRRVPDVPSGAANEEGVYSDAVHGVTSPVR